MRIATSNKKPPLAYKNSYYLFKHATNLANIINICYIPLNNNRRI